MRNQRVSNTLQTTALVNEAYLRLVDVKNIDWQQRAQFFSLSAQIMRRILVDAARARGSHKRGGGAVKIDRSWRALETDLWLRFQSGGIA
jgi:hypothetical protein